MNLQQALAETRVSEFRYFDSIGSTNDEALRWLTEGAPDLALVIADEQTKGRGRFDRRWVTLPESSLAFSLILTSTFIEARKIPLYAPLGGIAVQEVVKNLLGLDTRIKWPNDVLLNNRKFCGILVEAAWQGSDLLGVVMGIGINVSEGSLPAPAQQNFPTTSLETACGYPVDRFELLKNVINAIDNWRPELGSARFMHRWEEHLAFKGECVRIEHSEKTSIIGKEVGIDPSGQLILMDDDGQKTLIEIGDVHLRPGSGTGTGGSHVG